MQFLQSKFMSDSTTSPFARYFNYSAAIVCFLIAAIFIYWGLGYTHYNSPMLFVLAALFGLFMGFNIGGNDVANSFGTSTWFLMDICAFIRNRWNRVPSWSWGPGTSPGKSR